MHSIIMGETFFRWKTNSILNSQLPLLAISIYTVKKCGVTECPRGAIFSCFHGNSMSYHGNMKILLPWGVSIYHIFFTVYAPHNYMPSTNLGWPCMHACGHLGHPTQLDYMDG